MIAPDNDPQAKLLCSQHDLSQALGHSIPVDLTRGFELIAEIAGKACFGKVNQVRALLLRLFHLACDVVKIVLDPFLDAELTRC